MLSYEKCKELKEAGFPQESFLFYDSLRLWKPKVAETTVSETYSKTNEAIYIVVCPSFEEIWEQLPEYIILKFPKRGKEYLELHTHSLGYWPTEEDSDGNIVAIHNTLVVDNNITEAAADLWLLLKKEELINA